MNEINPFVKIIPLSLKLIGLKIASKIYGERKYTSTISNLGYHSLPESFLNHLDRLEVLIGKTIGNTVNCAVLSTLDTIYFYVTSTSEKSQVHKKLKDLIDKI